jgi:hypothetical protein
MARNNTEARIVLGVAEEWLLRAVRVNDIACIYFCRAAKAIGRDFLVFASVAIPMQVIEANVRVSSLVLTICGIRSI